MINRPFITDWHFLKTMVFIRDVAPETDFSTQYFLPRGVAQLGRARRSGRRGRRFESCHPDFLCSNSTIFLPFSFYSTKNHLITQKALYKLY